MGRTKGHIDGFTILILVAIGLTIAAIIALLSVPAWILIILLSLSVIGICVNIAVGKPDITPEDKLRESTIKEYQVPNTKEALLEFSILATQKIRPVSKMAKIFSLEAKRQIWLNRMWMEKCNAIYTRARLAMKDDTRTLDEIARLM
ncbi:MAG: hypothetical protein FWD22_05760, partial [Treponema sp.]|nr:hypothetical protein [Treponema sp.]